MDFSEMDQRKFFTVFYTRQFVKLVSYYTNNQLIFCKRKEKNWTFTCLNTTFNGKVAFLYYYGALNLNMDCFLHAEHVVR